MTGLRFGKLQIISRSSVTGRIKWRCICDCGTIKDILGENIRAGKSKSCGCLSIGNNFKHGFSWMKEYHAWHNMIERCSNPKNCAYKNYGARGITVSKRWLTFENFLVDMGLKPNPKWSLERKKNDKGYNKRNCCWASRKDQNNNRRPYRKRIPSGQW